MKKVILLTILALLTINISSVTAKNKIDQDMLVDVSVSGNKLHGVVLDKLTNESLAGVAVNISGQKVYTDLDGNFAVDNVCKGICEIKISMISYEDQILAVDTRINNSVKIQLSQR